MSHTICAFIAGPSKSRPSVKKFLYISPSLISPRSNLIQVLGCLTANNWPSTLQSLMGLHGRLQVQPPGSDLLEGHAQSLRAVCEEGVLHNCVLQGAALSIWEVRFILEQEQGTYHYVKKQYVPGGHLGIRLLRKPPGNALETLWPL